MADNYANPLAEAETDVQKATRTIVGLLDPKEETKKQQPTEQQQTEEQQNSPEPTQEESSTEDQPE